jgi:hypothetical protein
VHALLHHIIIDVEGLHHSSSNDIGSLDANDGTQFKNPEYITLLPLLPNKRETYFVNISSVQLVLFRGKRTLLETRSNSKPSLLNLITSNQYCISLHKYVYKPNTNAM